jgi:hypothetical protein
MIFAPGHTFTVQTDSVLDGAKRCRTSPYDPAFQRTWMV